MKATKKLFAWKDLYDTAGTEELFTAAMGENCAFHYAHCPEYAALLDGRGFSPEKLTGPEDLSRLPPIPTVYFKRHRLLSLPEKKLFIKATSSGTRGLKSEVGLDWQAVRGGARMIFKVARYHKTLSLRPTNYLILGYQPHKSNQTAVAKTATGYTYLAPGLHREYALKYGPEGYYVDFDGLIAALKKYSRSHWPTRLMGFPSYTWFLLEQMEERGLAFTLPKGSQIYLGGGWKEFYRQEVDKHVFYQKAWERLGVPEGSIRESFGAVEHPVWYADCPHHHFHVPVYSRVLVRDVDTLEPLPMGQMGLVNLLTPLTLGCPILSVMTDDLGILHPGESCSCGIASPWLEIIGRVGMVDIKTCAAGADDIKREAGL